MAYYLAILAAREIDSHCNSLQVDIEISKIRGCFALFLHSFRPKVRESAQRRDRASQGAPCSALKLGVLPQDQPEPMPAIAALRFAQSREINLKNFSEGHLNIQFYSLRCLEYVLYRIL